jgi:hypothetical protein
MPKLGYFVIQNEKVRVTNQALWNVYLKGFSRIFKYSKTYKTWYPNIKWSLGFNGQCLLNAYIYTLFEINDILPQYVHMNKNNETIDFYLFILNNKYCKQQW